MQLLFLGHFRGRWTGICPLRWSLEISVMSHVSEVRRTKTPRAQSRYLLIFGTDSCRGKEVAGSLPSRYVPISLFSRGRLFYCV